MSPEIGSIHTALARYENFNKTLYRTSTINVELLGKHCSENTGTLYFMFLRMLFTISPLRFSCKIGEHKGSLMKNVTCARVRKGLILKEKRHEVSVTLEVREGVDQ